MGKSRLEGKVALITGGARGMGASEAALFADEGASVVVSDLRVDAGEETARRVSPDGSVCRFVRHDVTSEDDWVATVAFVLDTFGRIDILVNNAGIFEGGTVLDTTLEAYRRTIDINQVGVFLGMKSVAPLMVAQKSGSIVNISSVAGMAGTPGFLAYGASKWAVRGMTKGVARELAPYGVRVNSIHPGIIDTPMLAAFDDAGVRELVRQRIPVGYEAEPVHVARLALYLASDDSSYSTGSEFIVDGGWSA
ncbi:MAG: glucose 1-dehydrogenase [Actinobacteria bacterium]|nr:glucose 1-dehydrogenase [Actinomycetota bacterium]